MNSLFLVLPLSPKAVVEFCLMYRNWPSHNKRVSTDYSALIKVPVSTVPLVQNCSLFENVIVKYLPSSCGFTKTEEQ